MTEKMNIWQRLGIQKTREIDEEAEKEKAARGVTSYHVRLRSQDLPFVIGHNSLRSIDKSNKLLEKFIRELEKRFDVIWYMGADYLGDELYERFMFHHGGFMEISLKGEINCYLPENKVEKLKDAILCAVCRCESMLGNKKLSHRLASEKKREQMMKDIRVEQKLISLKDSLLREGGRR